MKTRDESQAEAAEGHRPSKDEPAFGLFLAIVVAGLLWLALAALAIAIWC